MPVLKIIFSENEKGFRNCISQFEDVDVCPFIIDFFNNSIGIADGGGDHNASNSLSGQHGNAKPVTSKIIAVVKHIYFAI